MSRYLLSRVKLRNESHGIIRHVGGHRHVFVFEIFLEIIQVIFLAVISSALEIFKILCQINIVVVWPVIFKLYFRASFFDHIQHMDRNQPEAERIPFFLEDLFAAINGFLNDSFSYVPVLVRGGNRNGSEIPSSSSR